MSTSLYQKYRPTTFADVVGQDHITTTLQNELLAQAWSHAYLFSGSRGVGKTTTARLLARAVNCLNRQGAEPDNECIHCVTALQGKAMDIIEIDAASHTGVDNVRENIIENARVAPAQFPWKVFIIDEVHMLSTSAFNALLKTLEEPPARTMFILATTEIHKVPATIASRCEQFQFKRVASDEMAAKLKRVAEQEGVKIDDAALAAIAKRADGGLRDAESLLGQVLSMRSDDSISVQDVEKVLPHADLKEVVGLIAELVTGKSAEAMQRASTWHENGAQMQQYLLSLLEVLRLGLVYRVSGTAEVFGQLLVEAPQQDFLAKLFSRQSVQQIQYAIEVFLKAAGQQKTTPIAALPLEMAIASLAAPVHDAPQPQAPSSAQSSASAVSVARPATALSEQAADLPTQIEAASTPSTESQSAATSQQSAAPSPGSASEEGHSAPTIPPTDPASVAGVQTGVKNVKSVGKKDPSEEVLQEEEQLPVIQVDEEEEEDDAAAEELQQNLAEEVTVEGTVEVAAQAETQEEQKEEHVPPVAEGEISLAAVRQHWNTVLDQLKEKDHALYLTMKVGQIASVQNSTITFGFEYQFYKDRLEDAQNRSVLEGAFSQALGGKVSVEATVSQEFAKEHADDVVENIVEPSEDEVVNVWDLATQNFGPKLSES